MEYMYRLSKICVWLSPEQLERTINRLQRHWEENTDAINYGFPRGYGRKWKEEGRDKEKENHQGARELSGHEEHVLRNTC